MGKTVLVVDDDLGVLEAFQVLLESEGFSVTAVSRSEKLPEILEKNVPDIILLDVLLSGADGREICQQLKRQERTKKIPVIMVSAHPNAQQSVKSAGADDFLAKPFDMDVLLNKIAKYTKPSS